MPSFAIQAVDIGSIAIGGFALVVMAVIVIRKFSIISSIDTSIVPKHQQEEIRDELAERRLMRKFQRAGQQSKRILSPFFHRIADAFHDLIGRLLHLEKRTRYSILRKKSYTKNITEKIQSVFTQAQAFFTEGNLQQAEALCIECITAKPTFTPAFALLGDIYMAKKDYASARDSYAHAITLKERSTSTSKDLQQDDDPKSLSDHYGDLAECFLAMADYQQARKAVEEVLKYQPNNPKFLDYLITICVALKDSDSAASALGRLKEVNPENNKLQDFFDQITQLEKSAKE